MNFRSVAKFATFLLVAHASTAWATKLNFEAGVFSIKADPTTSGGTAIDLRGPGIYAASGQFALRPSLELGIGYSVFFSKGITGDMGYGPDFSLLYFPLTEGSGVEADLPNLKYREIKNLRPYASFSFHQRQFQSIQSSYSGFGLGLGSEVQWSERSALRLGFRSMTLLGPSSAKFQYFDLMLGLQRQF